MGIANIAKKQIVKGLIYLGCEIAFIYFFVTIGIERLQGLITLGTKV